MVDVKLADVRSIGLGSTRTEGHLEERSTTESISDCGIKGDPMLPDCIEGRSPDYGRDDTAQFLDGKEEEVIQHKEEKLSEHREIKKRI